MFRPALVILSGNAAASIFLLARNLIVARMIPVADYGVAATFAMAMAVVEMASALGLQQQIIQSKDGDDPRFQAALQGFQVVRGVISGAILFALAGPLARFLGIPEVAWAYQVLALVPILNALVHFDIHRVNRQMRFWPLILTDGISTLASLLLIWPFAYWFGDWQIMLWAILAQAVFRAFISHLLAERSYELVWDIEIIAGSMRFGWPLLVNSALMFFVFQGDKLIVGRTMGMTELAIFSIGTTLALTPTLVLAKSAQSLFLPQLSRALDTPNFVVTAQKTLQTISLSALLFVFATLLVGGPFLNLMLGAKYKELFPLLIWFALGQAIRVTKAGPAIVALALGHTSNVMFANLARVASLPIAMFVAVSGGHMLDILMVALVGEGLGLAISIWLMLNKAPLPRGRVLQQQGVAILIILAVGSWAWIAPHGDTIAPWYVWVACTLGFASALASMPETTQHLRSTK